MSMQDSVHVDVTTHPFGRRTSPIPPYAQTGGTVTPPQSNDYIDSGYMKVDLVSLSVYHIYVIMYM